MDIFMDIHAKSVDMDMDMDEKIHIHGNRGYNPLSVLFNIMFLALICRRFLRYRGLHARTAVARLVGWLSRLSIVKDIT